MQTTPGGFAPVLTSVKPYRRDHGEPPEEPLEEPPENQFPGGDREPVGNHDGSRQRASVCPTNDRDVPQKTGTDKPGGGLALVTEPRCRCCRDPDLRDRINRMIAGGFSLRAIYESLASVKDTLGRRSRITMDSLETHRRKHFNTQMGASAIYRRILEERVAADAVNYENGMMNLLTPRVFFETVMVKGYANLIDESAQVTLDQSLAASRELAKLAGNDDVTQRWAEIHATQAKIVACIREACPPELHEEILARCEGRPWPPPSGGRATLIEGGVASDDEFAFDEDDEDFDDED